MNKTILAIILIALGGVLLYFGNRRENSVAGQAQAVGHDVANTFDGKARVNDHTLYYVGGGALILVGLIVAIRRSA